MFYDPNQKAALKILENVYPKINRLKKDIKFTFVGMVPDTLKVKYSNKKDVVFTGVVQDLNEFLSNASIALCPVFEGSGMKVKILNYCAAGLPIITTTIGVSGYEKLTSLIIEDDIEKYYKIINRLLDSSVEIKKIGINNKNLAKKYFDVDVVAKKLINNYIKIINSWSHKRKLLMDKIDVPLPIWLEENRIAKIKNNRHYIIKNESIKIK